MTSLFDPFDPVGSMGRLWTRGQRDAQSWFEQWADATSAWTSAVPTPERLLGQLIDGVFARFGGRRITLTIHGDEVSGVLDVLRVSGPAGDHRALAMLTEVDWRGRRIDEVVVRARAVRISPGLTSTLTAAPVEIEGRAALSEALAFAEASDLEWQPRLDAAGSCVRSTATDPSGSRASRQRTTIGSRSVSSRSAMATSASGYRGGCGSCAISTSRCPQTRTWSMRIGSVTTSRSGCSSTRCATTSISTVCAPRSCGGATVPLA